MAEEVRIKRKTASEIGSSHERSLKGIRKDCGAEETRKVEESGLRQVALGREESVTAQDVEDLIDNAREAALGAQGSEAEWRRPHSHLQQEFKMQREEGSKGSREDSSQRFHLRVRELVERHLSGVDKPLTVGCLGDLVVNVLQVLEQPSCRPRSKAGKEELFPIPVAALHQGQTPTSQFLRAVVVGLNSLHSYGNASPREQLTPIGREVVKRLDRVVSESRVLREPLPDLDFASFFCHRSLDYSGEEVRVAQKVEWSSIEPSLPPEVGCLDIRDFCFGGVYHFITHIDDTIIPVEDQVRLKPPSVMVRDLLWEEVAQGLVSRGLCEVIAEENIYKIQGLPLLNGLFAVGKDEVKNGVAVSRLIMNLKPWNKVSRSLVGDVSTLPAVSQLSALHLHDQDVLLTSSEDLRCFFYLFRVPPNWVKFMAFGKEAPSSLVPPGGEGQKWFLAGKVLPMGYLNSVGIAQHIHRCVIQRAIGSIKGLGLTAQEIRRDRVFSRFPNLFRVYLDNFDQLQKVDRCTAALVSGSPSELVEQVREFYAQSELPRHPKKSVAQALEAEVQGAWVDGTQGVVFTKPSKIAKYIKLALELLGRGKASQRELQVVGGGFVYIAMFCRPLLSSLNQIWRMIVDHEDGKPSQRHWLRKEVMVELTRFIGLCPLGVMNLRYGFDPMVTASDASSTGGGICASQGLSPYGLAASTSTVRGDIPEEQELTQVLSVGLFDGIGALRMALDVIKAPVAGHISVEMNAEAQRVVEANFPESIQVEDIEAIDEEMVHSWALRFTCVGLVLIGSGPPCQGVPGLNADRKGALRDKRSMLFLHIPKITKLFKRFFPWAQVHGLTENVASMDREDCEAMNKEYQLAPWFIDSSGISLAHRPRLYWISWEILEQTGVEIYWGSDGRLPILGQVDLTAEVDAKAFLEAGWTRVSEKPFPTFTTSRPSPRPLRRPAGFHDCDEQEKERWRADAHRFPPYQYKACHCLQDRQGNLRTPSVQEREAILGFPPNYTLQCFKKGLHGSKAHEDCRLSLVGNSWSVGVIAWLLQQLTGPLGLTNAMSVQQIVDELTPGRSDRLQSLLMRPPFSQGTQTFPPVKSS